MSRISKYENLVLCILTQHEDTRGDDRILYLRVLHEEGFSTNITLYDFLTLDGYPNYDSISRVRRKLQERYPELRPAKNVQERREEAEEDFRAYARGEDNG